LTSKADFEAGRIEESLQQLVTKASIAWVSGGPLVGLTVCTAYAMWMLADGVTLALTLSYL